VSFGKNRERRKSNNSYFLSGRSRGIYREKLLFEAYSIDAFACHFLTDAFATGHMRYDVTAAIFKTDPDRKYKLGNN
jgi:hypothetical protein